MHRDPNTIGQKLVSDLPELWTAKDAAQHFGRSVKTIGYVVRSRAIAPVARIGTKKFYDMAGIELMAIALSEIESIAGVADRLNRLEVAEQETAADVRRFRNDPEMMALLEKEIASLRAARNVIERCDQRVNLQTIR